MEQANMAPTSLPPKNEEPEFFNADFMLITISAIVLQAFVILYFYTFVV